MSSSDSLAAVQALLAEEPSLMLPVSEYHPKVLNTDLEVGVASAFKEFYRTNLQELPGRISFYGKEVTATPEVLAALRAILYAGCCRCSLRAQACREVFMRACESGDHLDPETVLASFEQYPANPFITELQAAVKEVLS